jgi:hypothetical protein
MMWVYELWEGISGNMMASFDTEAEALAAVSRRAAQYGPQSLDSLSLVAVDTENEDADIIEVASGPALLRRVTLQQVTTRNGIDNPSSHVDSTPLGRRHALG